MNRKHFFLLAGGLSLVGLVAVLFLHRGGEEPSLNPPKKKPTVKMYHVEGLDYPVVFEDGCNLKNLDIILKDLELIISQTDGFELGLTEHIDYWNVLIGNEKKVAIENWGAKDVPGAIRPPTDFSLGFVIEYQGVKCFPIKKFLVKLYNKRIEMLGENPEITRQLAAFMKEVEGGLKKYNKLEEALLYLSQQNIDIADELEAEGEITLDFIQKLESKLKYDTPSILNYSRLGDDFPQGPEAFGAYGGFINVETTAERRDDPGRKLSNKKLFIYDKGRWKIFLTEPGT